MRGAGRHRSEDFPDYHALQPIVFIDIEMAHIGHMLEIDILQHVTEVLARDSAQTICGLLRLPV
jgi:hypothetical protein